MSGTFVRFGVLTVTVIAFARTAWVIGDCLRTRLRRRSLVPPLVTQPPRRGCSGSMSCWTSRPAGYAW